MADIGSNLFALPHQLALEHDRAQASKLNSMNQGIQENNRTMRKLYSILHEIEALTRQNKDSYDLTEFQEKKDEFNELYKAYRADFLSETEASQGSIEAGALGQLFPEDLSEVSLHELQKIEGKVKEQLEHCTNFNTQSTQDLYLMLQLAVVMHTAFQKTHEDMSSSARYMVRNQRS